MLNRGEGFRVTPPQSSRRSCKRFRFARGAFNRPPGEQGSKKNDRGISDAISSSRIVSRDPQ